MSNVIIDLKNIDITFTQKRRTIQAVKDVSIQIEKVIFTELLVIQGLVNLPLCAQSIFCKCLPLVKSLSVKM